MFYLFYMQIKSNIYFNTFNTELRDHLYLLLEHLMEYPSNNSQLRKTNIMYHSYTPQNEKSI